MSDVSTHINLSSQESSGVDHQPFRTLPNADNAFRPFEKEEIENSISGRFEQQVETYPDRVAVKAKGITLTYRELNRTANRIARVVLDLRGEGPEPIAIMFEPDIVVIAVMLGVWKAGKLCPWTLGFLKRNTDLCWSIRGRL